jgi:hypothetical protein
MPIRHQVGDLDQLVIPKALLYGESTTITVRLTINDPMHVRITSSRPSRNYLSIKYKRNEKLLPVLWNAGNEIWQHPSVV